MQLLRTLRYLAITAMLYCLAVVLAAPLPVAPLPTTPAPPAAAVPVQPIAIISQPRAKQVLKGTVRVIGTVTGVDGITYAILSVDGNGRSMTNGLPLRFELDTTRFADGAHILKVEAFDGAGSLATSPSLPVFIKNAPTVVAVPMPKTPVVKAPVAPKPATVVKTPVAPKPTPVVTLPVPLTTPTVSYTTAKPVPAKAMPAPMPTPTVSYTTAKPAAPRTMPAPLTVPTVRYTRAPQPTPVATVAAPRPTPTVVYLAPTAPRAKTASGKLVVLLDGMPVTVAAEPYISDGRVMVVLRGLLERTGGKVSWNHRAKQAIASYNEHHYIVTPAQRDVMKDGVPTALPEVATLTKGRLYIPVAAWRQLFDGSVAYDAATRLVYLRTTATPQLEQAIAK